MSRDDAIAAGGMGPTPQTPHHPLAVDPTGVGMWGRTDRLSFAVADRLNPILIKETRESLKSRQFLITFFLLLAATVLWSLMGIVINAPDVYYQPTGGTFLAGYYLLMAIPIFGMVPLAAYWSLAGEIDNDTFELLSITNLASRQIVHGKFASAMLQMMLYLAAVVPSLAFTYLLRGVGIPEIAMVIVAVLLTGMVLTAFALMIAPLMTGMLGQSFAMLGLIGVIVFTQFVMGAILLNGVIGYGIASDLEAWMFTGMSAAMAISLLVLFLKSAAAQIAPVTENRSTSLRRWMLVPQAIWIVTITGTSIYFEDFEPVNFGAMILAGYWLVMGTLCLGESGELSPRVRRDLPSTFATRAFLTVFSPGPSTGYLFAICSGSVAILCQAIYAELKMQREPTTSPSIFAAVLVGYLLAYLGMTRLLCLMLLGRSFRSPPACLIVLCVVLLSAAFAPSIIFVATTGRLASDYNDLEIINWAWTSAEAFNRGGLPGYLGIVALGAGLAITAVNFVFLGDVYAYRRVAVPQRVRQDQED